MERQATRETWAKRIERWKDSGLSAKQFATELGVSPRSLTWWRWRLETKADNAKPPVVKSRRRGRPPKAAPPVTFIEMPGVARMVEALEVVLPSNIRIRVPAGFDPATLEQLVAVLDRRR